MLGMALDNYITTWYTFANLVLTRHTSSSMTDIVLASRADWRCLDEALGERFSWCRRWYLQYRRARTDDSADESRHRVILTAQWLWPLGCFCCQEIGANGRIRTYKTRCSLVHLFIKARSDTWSYSAAFAYKRGLSTLCFSFFDLFINIFQKAHPVLKIKFISKIKPFLQTLI